MTHTPIWSRDGSSLFQGDCYPFLREHLPENYVDAVVTDPPYNSGGMTRGDRTQATSAKYVVNGTALSRPEFSGDTRDQRAFLAWATLWLGECLRVTKPGGYLMMFTDWRQLPIMTDAVQAGGWVWRGVNVWDKTEGSRPQLGWFRAQCEYVILASKGGMGAEQNRSVKVCAPGLWRGLRGADDRAHMTGKPVGLMHHLLSVLPERAIVLDPFTGGGSTAVACLESNRDFIGIEYTKEYAEITKARLEGILPVVQPAFPL